MRNQNNTWIESVPKDWAIGRISYKYQVQLGKMLQPEPISIFDIKKPYLRSANLDWHGVKLEDVKEMWFSPNDLKKYKIEPSDVLVSEGGDVGRTSFWNESIEMYIQNAVNRLRPLTEESNPKFLFYWFSFLKTHGLIDIMCDSSTISHYTAEKVKATQLVFPTFSEQTLIARFLDQKTSQIDRLIEQKEKLLKLLAEKRTAIITQAVTKGLDPNAEMKDSGIEWLGEIPKHWEVKPLKFVVHLINEKFDELGDLTYLGLEHIESWTTKRILDEDAKSEGVVTRFQPDDVLFGKLRPYLAKVYLADFEGGVSTEALVLRSGSEVLPAYLKYYLVSDLLIDVINSSTYGSKMPRASWNFIGRLPMILPSIDIQKDIVEYLTTNIGKFDISISKIKKSINHLKEYREALITSAVTGQIDVRKEVLNG